MQPYIYILIKSYHLPLQNCRHAIAVLSFGNKVQPLSFNTSLNEITPTPKEKSSIKTNIKQEGTKTKDNENKMKCKNMK